MKEKDMEVIINIEVGEASHGAPVKTDLISSNTWVSLNKLFGGLLNYNGPEDGKPSVKFRGISGNSVGNSHENLELLVDKKNPGARNSMGLETVVGKGYVKGRRKSANNSKAAKPPRPPNGPTLDAADKWFIEEITRAAMMKKERAKRIKTLKNTQSTKVPSSSTLLSLPTQSTILASIITFLCLLVLIFQAAPQATQVPVGLLSPVQF